MVLFYEPFYLYVNAENKLYGKKRVSENDLDGADIWLLKDGHCFRDQVINYCSIGEGQHSAVRNLSFEGGNFETLRNLVRNGRGYTLFPQLFIEGLSSKEKELNVKPFVFPMPTREVSLVYRRGQWKTDILSAMRSEIVKSIPVSLKNFDKNKIQVVSIT
jgi:LysR family hydrogen peroxide-inducible transcriptional activator